MGNYIDPSELIIYGLPEEATVGLSSDELSAHIDAAEALADSYIGARGYDVPLPTPDAGLKSAVGRIAGFAVLSTRGLMTENAAHMTLMKGRDDAVAWLRDVAAGKANLASGAPGGGLAARRQSNVATIVSCKPRGW